MAKLKPRARIIRTIGDQLISGPEAAIIELVKNSYDADASFVQVGFCHSEAGGFSISIRDDGHGMTYTELVENWLEPATDTKVKNPYSRSGARRLLGAKGIGRFAVSRLGEICLLTSLARADPLGDFEVSSILIDWSQFSADRYLDEIELDIVREPAPPNEETGVEIEVTQLRDSWSKSQLERLIMELRRLANPRKNDEFSIYLDIEQFRLSNSNFDGATVFEEQNGNLQDPTLSTNHKNLIQPYILGNVSDYSLEGEFLENGSFKGVFQIQRGDDVKQTIEIPPLALLDDESPCGPLKIRLNLYDREVDAIENLFARMKLDFQKVGIRRARKILTEMSGISIVRSSFRIRPYGDPSYDWLGLQAKRVQDPSKKMGSDQVSGFIEIADEEQSGILERSSREGLEENGQYRRLRSLIFNLLPHIEERRFEFREKAGIGRRPATNLEKAREASKLKQVNKALNKIPEEHRQKLLSAIEKDAASINQMLDEVDDYQKILQSHSSLGLVVAEVIHEGRRRLNPMLTSIKTLKSDYEHAFDNTQLGRIYRETFPLEIDSLLGGGTALSKLFKRLDPISGRKRGRPVDFRLIDVVNDTLSVMGHVLDSNSIRVSHSVEADIVCYGYREDLHAVFLNLVENASYWLSTLEDIDRCVSFSVEKQNKKLLISVSNNGPLIDEAYDQRLFDAGFSLKSEGTGLGLAIAREACRASKGELRYDPTKDDTTFVIEFPLGKKA